MLNKRQLMLYAALIVTLVAVYFAPPKPTEELVEANKKYTVKITSINHPIEQSVQQDSLSFISKRKWPVETSQNLFPNKIKLQSAPAILLPQVQLPLPKPTAPALPFVYIGKVIEEGKPTVFVSLLQKNYFLKGGEVIDGAYRVDKVESGQVVFTYLPLGIEQVMIIGGKD